MSVSKWNLSHVGNVVFTCPDAYACRVSLEIMSGLTTCGTLRFCPDGLIIVHRDDSANAEAAFHLPDRMQLKYEMKFHTPLRFKEVYSSVNLMQMVDACKSYDKREEVTITGEIMENGIISTMNMQRNMDAVDGVDCDSPVGLDIKPYQNKRIQYYGDSRPATKLVIMRFYKIISGLKCRSCSVVSFVLTAEGVVIKGYQGDKLISISRCDSNGDGDGDGESDGDVIQDVNDTNGDTTAVGSGGPGLVIVDYAVTINFRKVKEWMNKINRLSPARSVISIYLSSGCPLIIESMIGSVGTATFTFENPS